MENSQQLYISKSGKINSFTSNINFNQSIETKTVLKNSIGQKLSFYEEDLCVSSSKIALVSQKLIQNHSDWLIADIEDILMEKLGLLWIIWIPVFWQNPNERLQKHLCFQDEQTVLLKSEPINPKYKENLKMYLKNQGMKVK